ncbi:hypothetical protein LINGRAHAP2_LOCUS28471, partial [Linum grandiflorum]
ILSNPIYIAQSFRSKLVPSLPDLTSKSRRHHLYIWYQSPVAFVGVILPGVIDQVWTFSH